MPPVIPRRSLVVRAAIASPPGTEKTTRTGRSPGRAAAGSPVTPPTSARAARIIRRGTGLMAGPPTGRPSPGLVIVPIPGPLASSLSPAPSRQVTSAVIRAPSVQSGSSPASLTTTAVGGRPGGTGPAPSTAKATRFPLGRPTSTSAGTAPVTRPVAAALAAADAQVPVVKPVRSPGRRRAGPPGSPSSPSLGSGAVAGSAGTGAPGPRRRPPGGRPGGRATAEAVGEPGVVEVAAGDRALEHRPDEDERGG